MTLPRPEVIELLGIGYRRIPLLAIGNDVYCDTSLIVPQLEKRVPPSAEYASVFPARKDGGKVDSGIIKAYAMSYGDRTLFPMGGGILPYAKLGKKFVEDRGEVRIFAFSVDSDFVRLKCYLLVARCPYTSRSTGGKAPDSRESINISHGKYHGNTVTVTTNEGSFLGNA